MLTRLLQPDEPCRICLQVDPADTLREQCGCKGSARVAHDECISKWLLFRRSDLGNICELCKTPYRRTNYRRRITITVWLAVVGALIGCYAGGVITIRTAQMLALAVVTPPILIGTSLGIYKLGRSLSITSVPFTEPDFRYATVPWFPNPRAGLTVSLMV